MLPGKAGLGIVSLSSRVPEWGWVIDNGWFEGWGADSGWWRCALFRTGLLCLVSCDRVLTDRWGLILGTLGAGASNCLAEQLRLDSRSDVGCALNARCNT
jgi:hypothetical protein